MKRRLAKPVLRDHRGQHSICLDRSLWLAQVLLEPKQVLGELATVQRPGVSVQQRQDRRDLGATGLESELLDAHTSSVTAVAFSPDGSRLVAATWERGVQLWDVRRREALSQLMLGAKVGQIAWGAGGIAAATPVGPMLLVVTERNV